MHIGVIFRIQQNVDEDGTYRGLKTLSEIESELPIGCRYKKLSKGDKIIYDITGLIKIIRKRNSHIYQSRLISYVFDSLSFYLFGVVGELVATRLVISIICLGIF